MKRVPVMEATKNGGRRDLCSAGGDLADVAGPEVDILLPFYAITCQWAARPLGHASSPFNGLCPVCDLRNLSQLILTFRHRQCCL